MVNKLRSYRVSGLRRISLPRNPVHNGLGFVVSRAVPDLGDAFLGAPTRPERSGRSLPRRASGGLFQGLQSLRTIHAGAPYEVHRRGVDLVDERVDAQVTRQVLVLLEQRAGLAGGLQ